MSERTRISPGAVWKSNYNTTLALIQLWMPAPLGLKACWCNSGCVTAYASRAITDNRAILANREALMTVWKCFSCHFILLTGWLGWANWKGLRDMESSVGKQVQNEVGRACCGAHWKVYDTYNNCYQCRRLPFFEIFGTHWLLHIIHCA